MKLNGVYLVVEILLEGDGLGVELDLGLVGCTWTCLGGGGVDGIFGCWEVGLIFKFCLDKCDRGFGYRSNANGGWNVLLLY